MEAHPIADLFPMLADDELTELADDIKQRGLLQPIVLDADGRVLDGRNRLAACAIAGVKPEFSIYEGDDPQGFALAVNIQRRSLTKGQQAMVITQAGAFSGKTVRGAARAAEVSAARLSFAKTVLDFAPDLADAVAAGTRQLNDAYEVARQRKREAAEAQAEIDQLRAEAPDLADDITEARLSLAAAQQLKEQRRAEAKIRERVEALDVIRWADGAPPPSFADRVKDDLLTWSEALTLADQWAIERNAAVGRAQDALRSVVTHWGAVRTVAESPDSPYVVDILKGLGESDRSALSSVLASLGGGDR